MTSVGGPSSWSQTSVPGSEMLIRMIGAKSSTNCESEAIPGVRMQVRTPVVPTGHCLLCTSKQQRLWEGQSRLLSVPPPYESCLLLLCPQTFEMGEIVVCLVHLTPDLGVIGFLLPNYDHQISPSGIRNRIISLFFF